MKKKFQRPFFLRISHEGIDILVEEAAEYHIPTSVQKAKHISESEQIL